MALRVLSDLGPPGRTALPLALADAERLRAYRHYLDFYQGKHFDRARAGRTSLVANYARAIVDKGVSYLFGRGLNFAVPAEPADDPAARERARRAERVLYRVYQDNDLEAVDLQAATNAAVLGDAVYKVFWDAVEARVRVVNADPFGFSARWAGDDLTKLTRVEQLYLLDPEDVVDRYGLAPAGPTPVVERWTETELAIQVGEREVRRGPNPYGFIPFVHVPNLQPPNQSWGISDLADVVPLNRELDERLSDMADVIRFHADPPVVFTGVREHSDLPVGPGTVWDLPDGADVKLLEWRGQQPAVQEHIERVLRALYEVAETPRTAFGDSGRLLSGVALEVELRPIVQKTLRKRAFWTAALRRRNALVLRLAERFGVDGARPGEFAPYRSRIIWPPMVPRDDGAEVDHNVRLVAAGLRSRRTALDALGEEDPEAELARIAAERSGPGGARPEERGRDGHPGGPGGPSGAPREVAP